MIATAGHGAEPYNTTTAALLSLLSFLAKAYCIQSIKGNRIVLNMGRVFLTGQKFDHVLQQ